MLKALIPFAVLLAPTVAQAQEAAELPALSLEQRTSLRCAAAFAIVSNGQANGNETALKYPPMQERGREFFVRASARLMDELGLDRAQIQQLVSKEAQELWDSGAIEDVMPACLSLLDASGI